MLNLPSAFLAVAAKVGSLAGAPFYDGAIGSEETPGHYDDDGNWVPGEAATERPCKVQIDVATEAMRQTDGFVDGDVRFIILAASVTGSINTDAIVKIAAGDRAGTWMVSSLELDPARIGWVGRGRRA